MEVSITCERIEEGHLMAGVSNKTMGGTPTRELKQFLEVRDLDRLNAAANNPRDRAFASLLGRDGARVSEAIRLKESEPKKYW